MNADDAILTPDQELAAWDAWKNICFVDGCPPLERSYLRRRIVDKMTRELLKCGIDLQQDNRLGVDELITIFDQFLAHKDGAPARVEVGLYNGSMSSAGNPRNSFKQYKEHVWSKVALSGDPPMRVINGLLLGPRGMAMEVLRQVLKDYFSAQEIRIVNQESGKIVRRYQWPRSLQEKIDDLRDQSRSLEEQLVDSVLPPPDEQAMHAIGELRIALAGLTNALSREEKVILLASLFRLKASDPRVCSAIGRQKSTACALQKNTQGKLQQWYQTSDDAPAALSLAVHQVLSELLMASLCRETHPAMHGFLGLVRDAQNGLDQEPLEGR